MSDAMTSPSSEEEEDELAALIGRQSCAYFRQHHTARMDEMHMFLESEAWALCPLPHGFSARQLPEFSFISTLNSAEEKVNHVTSEDEQRETGYELLTTENENPFLEPSQNHSNKQDSVVESDSDESEDLKQDFVEETPVTLEGAELTLKSSENLSPVICNTALNLLRIFGKYLNMGAMLRPIAYDSVIYTVQLFDYFFYSVIRLFSSDFCADCGVETYSVKLFNTLQRIDSTLIASNNAKASGGPATTAVRVPASGLSPAVDLNAGEQLFALAERVVAVESLVFVSQQLENLQPVLESFVPADKRPFLQQFYSQTVSAAVVDARRAVYGAVASRALAFRALKQRIASTNWDIAELRSQHSAYVDSLIQEFDSFQHRFNVIRRVSPVSKEVYDCVWSMAVRCANRVIVDGYAANGGGLAAVTSSTLGSTGVGIGGGGRCTNEGRMLMQLDYQQLVVKLEAMSGMRPLPDKDYVENYIKAYYLPESAVEKWILEHQEYTNRQLATVLRVATHISKKSRQRLLAMLEEANGL